MILSNDRKQECQIKVKWLHCVRIQSCHWKWSCADQCYKIEAVLFPNRQKRTIMRENLTCLHLAATFIAKHDVPRLGIQDLQHKLDFICVYQTLCWLQQLHCCRDLKKEIAKVHAEPCQLYDKELHLLSVSEAHWISAMQAWSFLSNLQTNCNLKLKCCTQTERAAKACVNSDS